MIITVIDNTDSEVIYNGDADLFLEQNDYDSEVEEALNELDGLNVGSKVTLYGFQSDSYSVIKENESLEEGVNPLFPPHLHPPHKNVSRETILNLNFRF